MPSPQAHFASWLIRRRLKPRLHAQTEVEPIRTLMRLPPFPLPRRVRITAASLGSIPGEWVETANVRATMLYLHGGGYFACSPRTHRPVTCAFARQGFRVFAPDYRLAPEHVFPAALEDANAAYFGLLENTPADGIVVAGDSAGGGLSLALLVALRDARAPLPAAAALFSPWTDLAATGESIVCNNESCAMFFGADIGRSAAIYLGTADPRSPLASPLYADLRGLPPLVIHAGTHEVLRDDSTRFAERAASAGVRVELKLWPVVPHVWQLFWPLMPEARQSVREAAAFLHAAVAARAAETEPAETR